MRGLHGDEAFELQPVRRGDDALYGAKHNRRAGGFLVAAGAFSSLFWVGPVLGIPVALAGLYMAGARRRLWVCKDCNVAIEMTELAPGEKTKAEDMKPE